MSSATALSAQPQAAPPEINIVVVVDTSLALGQDFWSTIFKYLAGLGAKIKESYGALNKQRPLNVAFVSYGAADTLPTPIFTRRFFQPMAEVAKTSFAMSAILGISQTGARPKSGMAVLEGLVAALELCDLCIDPPLIENINALHRAPPPRPSKPQLHILLFAALPPDNAKAPLWNNNTAFDALSWDGLADEIRKRDIGFNMLLVNPIPKLAELHKTVVPNPTQAWFPVPAGHTVYFEHFAPSKAGAAASQPLQALQPKLQQENKRPLEDTSPVMPDAKRFKASPAPSPVVPPPAPVAPKQEAPTPVANTAPSAPLRPLDPATDQARRNQDLFAMQQYGILQQTIRAKGEILKKAQLEGMGEDELARQRQDLMLKAGMLRKVTTTLQERGLLSADGKFIGSLSMFANTGITLGASGSGSGTAGPGPSAAPSVAKTEFSPSTTLAGEASVNLAVSNSAAAVAPSPLRNVVTVQPPPSLQLTAYSPHAAAAAPTGTHASPHVPSQTAAFPAPSNIPVLAQLPRDRQELLLSMTRSQKGLDQLKQLITLKPDMKPIVEKLLAEQMQRPRPSGLGPLPAPNLTPAATMVPPTLNVAQPLGQGMHGASQALPLAQAPNPQMPQPPAQHKPVWQGTISWLVQGTMKKTVPVVAQNPRGDLRFDLWPTELTLKPYKKTFTKEELAAWNGRHHPALCIMHIAPEAAGTNDENTLKELIVLLTTKSAIALVHIPIPGMVHGIHLVIFTVENRLAVAAFVDKPVPELVDAPAAPPSIASLPAQQQQFLAMLNSLPPEAKARFASMPEQARMQTLQQWMVKRAQAQQQQQHSYIAQQQSMSMQNVGGIPLQMQPPFMQSQATFGQPNPGPSAPQHNAFGAQSQIGISLPQGMTFPPNFQNQPWQRPPGQ